MLSVLYRILPALGEGEVDKGKEGALGDSEFPSKISESGLPIFKVWEKRRIFICIHNVHIHAHINTHTFKRKIHTFEHEYIHILYTYTKY